MKQVLGSLFIMLCACCSYAQQKVTVKEENNWVFFKNNAVRLGFNLKNGLFYLKNAKGQKLIDNAYFQAGGLASKDSCERRLWSVEDINDELGGGKALTIKIEFENYSDILWQLRLYDDKEYCIFNMGIDNDTQKPYQLMSFYPLASNSVYPGIDNSHNYSVLDGNAGGSITQITDTSDLCSFNNVLVKFGEPEKPSIMVAGGVTYHEFEKFVKVSRRKETLQLRMYGEDPVGRRIDAGQKYWLNEKFYVCFNNPNPFEALEKYAGVLKKAQNIRLNYYDFPTECLWYASFYNIDRNRGKFNNSKGAVDEMDSAILSGITKYTKVAIRLVPDAYGANNEQGWWDDKHWGMYNEKMSTDLPHYTTPYLTTKSWAQAILARGGYPFTYFQSGRRSEDFVKEHPDWMLFNDPYKAVTAPSRFTQELSYKKEAIGLHWWTDKVLWGYDFTDPGFIKHMQKVYANLKSAGIKGIFFDYPEETAWAYEGGFEDKHATTASAYRNMFKLAYEGIGKDAMLQERNIIRGSDIALGLISSQRVWWDTDQITPDMITRCGLRWYKNRVVINYDMDSKDPRDAMPQAHNDGIRSMLTMCYVTSGRFLLGRSFTELSKEQLYDLSRIFPYPATPKTARPIDAFDPGVKYPRIYDFEVNPCWHQLTFYNYNLDSSQPGQNKIAVTFSKSLNEGGLGLDANKQYYVYDFWNDHLVGLFSGHEKLEQDLRCGEAEMMSVHAKEDHPQFISTNRHIMQGYMDLKGQQWDARQKTLSGVSDVIAGDLYTLVIAANGYKIAGCKASEGTCTWTKADPKDALIKVNIKTKTNSQVKWTVKFK